MASLQARIKQLDDNNIKIKEEQVKKVIKAILQYKINSLLHVTASTKLTHYNICNSYCNIPC